MATIFVGNGVLAQSEIVAWGRNNYGQTTVPAGLTNSQAIASGSYHNLALKADGTVTAWGLNSSGQTNVPASLTNVVAVAVGSGNSLALKADGTVVAWGSSGQTSVPAGLSDVVAVSTGDHHSLALKADGTVSAWGSSPNGETNVPPDLANVVAVAAGLYHSMALKANGTVVVWGSGGFGQTQVPSDLNDAVAMATGAGASHCLAMKADGTVVGWGKNNYGQASVPYSFSSVAGIAVGANHSIVLQGDGTVLAWGYDNYGQVDVPPGLAAVAAVAGGYYHSIALVGDGAPCLTAPLVNRTFVYGNSGYLFASATGAIPLSYQWRFNGADLPGATDQFLAFDNVDFDQAGLYSVVVSNAEGAVTSSNCAVTVAALMVTGQPQGQSTYRGMPVTLNVTVASSLPLTYQWQFNGHDLADATDSSVTLPEAQLEQSGVYTVIVSNSAGSARSAGAVVSVGQVAPWGPDSGGGWTLPPGLTNVVAVAGGGSHNLALKADGTVAAWGSNSAGQTNVPPGLSNVVMIAGGGYHSLALRADGTVVAWGSNTNGQSNLPPGLSNVVMIAGGVHHSLALRANGTMVGWGDNTFGQSQVPVGLTNVVAVGGGLWHSLALKGDGTVIAWGDNGMGETNVPSGLKNVVTIATGFEHSLALKADGTLAAWGWGQYRQTVVPSGLTNVMGIAAGEYSSLALIADGSVVPWGANWSGAAQTNVPVGLTGVVQIASGWNDSMALMGVGKPFLTMPLVSRTVFAGTRISAGMAATGTPPLSYQWMFNGTNLPGATSSSLILDNIQLAQAGVYSVAVSNAFGVTASSNMTVTVIPLGVSVQPQSELILPHGVATFSASAAGQGPFTYQWQFNGTNIAGASGSSLTISNALFAQGGVYAVIVSNIFGTARSSDASLLVSRVVPWGDNSYGQTTNLPPDLTNVIAIAAGNYHTLALRPDGGVVAWGANDMGQLSVPPGLTNAIGIAGGYYHSLALRADGTVIAWGGNNAGQINVPVGLSNVMAVAAGYQHSLALKADGTIVAWGDASQGATSVPSGLSNVVAIAGGYDSSLALKGDGTIVGWGSDPMRGPMHVPAGVSNLVAIGLAYGGGLALKADGSVAAWGWDGLVETFPPGLTNVVAIAKGYSSSMGLRSDGSVISWQDNSTNQLSIPVGLPSAGAIVAGNFHSAALVGNGCPFVTLKPVSKTLLAGGTVTLTIMASGSLPLSFQWQFNGINLAGATNFSLTLTNVAVTAAGSYGCVVSNVFGTAIGSAATLNVSREPLRFDSTQTVLQLPDGGLRLKLLGLAGAGPVAVYASSDLKTWNLIFTNPPTVGGLVFTDQSVTNRSLRFYRAAELAGPLRSAIRFDTSSSGLHITNGGFCMRLTAISGHGPVVLYASTNLMTWEPISTNAPTIGTLDYLDQQTATHARRFYRAAEN